jgi:hypothetical protein
MNILNNRISEEYGIVSSEWRGDPDTDIFNFIAVGLSDGHEMLIELETHDYRIAYDIIERELTEYYLMKNRNGKIKKLKNKII